MKLTKHENTHQIPIPVGCRSHWSCESLLRVRDSAIALLLLRVVGAAGKFATCHGGVITSWEHWGGIIVS